VAAIITQLKIKSGQYLYLSKKGRFADSHLIDAETASKRLEWIQKNKAVKLACFPPLYLNRGRHGYSLFYFDGKKSEENIFINCGNNQFILIT
jgi:hypothetical protein